MALILNPDYGSVCLLRQLNEAIFRRSNMLGNNQNSLRTSEQPEPPSDLQSDREETKRFVLLWHDMPSTGTRGSHWDLMLRDGSDTFWTIAIEPPGHAANLPVKENVGDSIGKAPDWPSMANDVIGQILPPHRLAYWDYEGEVSGGRGWVKRVTRGTYRTLHDDRVERPKKSLEKRPEKRILLLRSANENANVNAAPMPDIELTMEILGESQMRLSWSFSESEPQ